MTNIIHAPAEYAAKITKQERDFLESQNDHDLLALRLAISFGTAEEVKEIKEINKRH